MKLSKRSVISMYDYTAMYLSLLQKFVVVLLGVLAICGARAEDVADQSRCS